MSDGHSHQYNARPIIIGIDEAGRGPIAGPVTVAAVALLEPLCFDDFEGVNDSKKLSHKRREGIRGLIDALKKKGALKTAVHSTPAEVIDQEGIVFATQLALSSALTALALPPAQCRVLLDGTLKAPGEYPHQETIIKGDETELSIMLAGILAKTERDREMTALSEQYPQYGFDMHKGYGTQSHYQSIRAAGLCALHRRTFVHPDQHLTD